MKKVLVISYYWPPSGGAGVQRCLKYVKYFREFGWEPIVYTAQDAEYPILDQSLLKEIPEGVVQLKQPIWEPYNLYKRFIGQKTNKRVYSGFLSESKKPKLSQRISVWLRGNFFIPDARRFWIRPSIKYLVKYLKENPVDAILSSGPPHTCHLIARGVKRALGIPWVADFRDPWTNIDFYDQLMLTSLADRKHKRLEQSVLKEADKRATVTWHWAEDFKKLGAEQMEVITNGFDDADFEFKRPEVLPQEFSFNHIGSLNKDRNPPVLWEAFAELCQDIPDLRKELKLRFIGKTDVSAFAELEKRGLMDVVENVDYMPHSEVLKTLVESQVLMLLINDTPNVLGVVPGKLFEYLAARRPILTIGPEEGDSARIVKEAGAGVVCGFTDKEKMKREIFKMYRKYKKGTLNIESADISRFTRKHATSKMAALLDEITQ